MKNSIRLDICPAIRGIKARIIYIKNAKNIKRTINIDNFLFNLNFSLNISIKGIIEYVITNDRINGNIVLVIILTDFSK